MAEDIPIMQKATDIPLRTELDLISGAATRTSAVFSNLRRDIVRGLLLPGEKLRVESLSQRYGVGTTPVREALNRLSAEGLVLQQDQKGFHVAPVSTADLLEVTRTRIWVNEIALRESILNGDEAWEDGVILAHRRLSRHPNRLPSDPGALNPVWEEFHSAFHEALIAACPSRMLLDFAARIFQAGDRYRHLAVRGTPVGKRDVKAEHLAIMEAAVGRHTDDAIRLLSDYTLRTTDALLAFLREEGAMSDAGSMLSGEKNKAN